jgi:ribosome assembly protein RRB1
LNKNHKSDEVDEDSSDDEDSEDEEADSEDGDGELRFRQIPVNGGASNRVRAMPQMRSIVSVFSEDGKVRVFNVQKAIEEVHSKTATMGGVMNMDPLFECSRHSKEGYGLAWNPVMVGQQVSGDDEGRVNIWMPVPGGSWEVSEMPTTKKPTGGVMDAAWKDAHVLATGHAGGAVRMWDTRGGSNGAVEAVKNEGGVDVNAVAWNPKVGELILTGNDDGSFKIYDARNFKVHLAHFHWHKEQITSVAWHPVDETTLLVASGDDSISFWDMSVEADDAAEEAENTEYPAQLLFLHQGQQWIKEAKFTTKYPDAVASTAADGFNFFRTCNI